MNIDIIPAWKQVTPRLQTELLHMWARHGAISDPGVAAARARQAVCVGRDESGELCAVATAIVRVVPRLRQPMYHYRQFFVEALRGHQQELPFYNQARAILQAYSASLPVPESIGILLELESRILEAHYDRACIEEAGSVFLGYSQRGLQLRATYFEGARLRAPAAARRRKPARV